MSISDAFRARLAGGATTMCLCWRLVRADGLVLGLTEHDRPISVDGVDYDPGAALEAAQFDTGSDLAPGYAAAAGALSSDAITDEDLQAGLWNGAIVTVIRADWQHTDDWLPVWTGRLGEITHGPEGFQAELVSLKSDLERPIGRIYSRRCDAILGDTRCGVDLDDPGFMGLTCDQSFDTCRTRFQNTDNFRGFPHMPGVDFVLSGPDANGTSGGQR